VDGHSIFSAAPSVIVEVSMLRPQMDSGEFPHPSTLFAKEIDSKGIGGEACERDKILLSLAGIPRLD
jgi:hypothetical protein